MGSEDLFHKRKARKAQDITRKKAKRDPYEKVLIVCEGEKTEPFYFTGLKDYYGLNGANVEITGDCGSDPMCIVEYTKQRYREERDAGDPFNRVYCVFDKDTHATYQQALDVISSVRQKDTFFAINSVPSFEYWLLLHFMYTTRPYMGRPGDSAGNQVLTELRGYMAEYTKGQKAIFAELIEQLDFAKANALRAMQAAEVNGTDNPMTKVHELVEYLQSLKNGEFKAKDS